MALARVNLVLQEDDGDLVDGASVEVRNEDTLALAPVFSDRAGTVSLGNPFTAADGADAGFYVAGGAYKITATLGGFSKVIRYQPAGTMAEFDNNSEDLVVGIGTTNPQYQLEISMSGSSENWGLVSVGGPAYGLTITGVLDNSANFICQAIGSGIQTLVEWGWYRARGDQATPTALQSGDVIGQWQMIGRSSTTGFALGGYMTFACTANWTGTNTGGKWNFYSVPAGTATGVLSLVIDGAGTAVLGTTTNNNATTGFVGEFIESEQLAGSGLTMNTPANVTSISLTAGDWDVWGSVSPSISGTTTMSHVQGSINTVSATHSSFPGKGAHMDMFHTFTTSFLQPSRLEHVD